MANDFIQRVLKERRKSILLKDILKSLENLGITKELTIQKNETFYGKSLNEYNDWIPSEFQQGPSIDLSEEQFKKWLEIFNFFINCVHEHHMAHKYIINTIEINHLINPNIEYNQTGEYTLVKKNNQSDELYDLIGYEGQISETLETEIEKVSLYTPGICVLILQILLEKLLKNSVNLVKKYSLGGVIDNAIIYDRSEIDNALSFLESAINLEYKTNFKLKGSIYKLRTARNAFTHGSWDNLSMTLNEIQVFDLLQEIGNLTFLITEKMLNSVSDPKRPN